MSFTRPTLTELRDRIGSDFEAHLPGADSRLRRAVLTVLVRVLAGLAHGLYGYLDWLTRQIFPDTADLAYLDRWAGVWGVIRKAAAPARGTLTVTGIAGAIIAEGALLQRIDGARFRVAARVQLAGASGAITVEAVEAGAAGDMPADSTLTFVSPAPGVAAVAIAEDGLTGGADEETDAALRARLLSRIRTPPNGGAASDWVEWAVRVPGVTRAWAYPGWTGPGTVGLAFVFDGRENILPLEADLEAMEAHLEPLRPVTATPVVFAPVAMVVNFLIGATPDNAEVRAAIRAELDDLFAREAEPGGTLYLSRMNEAVSLAAGEFDHRILSPAANIVAPAGQMPTLGTVTFV